MANPIFGLKWMTPILNGWPVYEQIIYYLYEVNTSYIISTSKQVIYTPYILIPVQMTYTHTSLIMRYIGELATLAILDKLYKIYINNAFCACSILLTKWQKYRDLACLNNLLSTIFPLLKSWFLASEVFIYLSLMYVY